MRFLSAALMIAVLTIPALTAPASAQSGRGLTRTEEPKVKVDDKGYESALKAMRGQDQEQGYDPWRTVREPPAAKELSKEPQPKSKSARAKPKP